MSAADIAEAPEKVLTCPEMYVEADSETGVVRFRLVGSLFSGVHFIHHMSASEAYDLAQVLIQNYVDTQ